MEKINTYKKIEKQIGTEIIAIGHLLFVSNRNLFQTQRTYLHYKLFDLIHSYLLNEKKIMELNGLKGSYLEKINNNLKNCDYSIQSNRFLIPALCSVTKDIEYWYDVPSSDKLDKIWEE